jgi:hypothetical protein
LQLGGCVKVKAPCPKPGPQDPIYCGGIAGLECPAGLLCIDDPHDDCDPEQGGADCLGLCVKPLAEPKPEDCDYDDPTRNYVSDSPQECQLILFTCVEGWAPFFDECGCGCELES